MVPGLFLPGEQVGGGAAIVGEDIQPLDLPSGSGYKLDHEPGFIVVKLAAIELIVMKMIQRQTELLVAEP